MDERERIRRDKALRRPKSSVALTFDVAGRRRAVQYQDADSGDDEEKDEGGAQLSAGEASSVPLACIAAADDQTAAR